MKPIFFSDKTTSMINILEWDLTLIKNFLQICIAVLFFGFATDLIPLSFSHVSLLAFDIYKIYEIISLKINH